MATRDVSAFAPAGRRRRRGAGAFGAGGWPGSAVMTAGLGRLASVPFLIIGHRGAAGLKPENTLASFRAAVALGVHGVELDVQRVQGELAVIHDAALERTTNGLGAVERQSFAALRRLDAGQGQRVPTLAEVLAAVPEHVLVNVELKGPGTAALVADALSNLARPLLVSSFDPARLAEFRRRCPQVPVAPLVGTWTCAAPEAAAALGAWGVHLPLRAVKAARIAALKRRGLRCVVYTVNNRRRAARLRSLGVDGVFTDYPNRLRELAPARPG